MNNFVIVSGHYGSGKTNIAINLALHLVARGSKLIFVDLDMVDPFFSSTDNAEILYSHGIEVITSEMSGKNVDIPVLPPNLYSIFSQDNKDVVVDIGADDNGARILGRFYKEIRAKNYQLLYVINYYRMFLNSMENVVALAKKIEKASRLEITGIVNNSNLYNETTVKDVLKSVLYIRNIAKTLDIPVKMTAVPAKLAPKLLQSVTNLYPVENHIKSTWDIKFV